MSLFHCSVLSAKVQTTGLVKTTIPPESCFSFVEGFSVQAACYQSLAPVWPLAKALVKLPAPFFFFSASFNLNLFGKLAYEK